MSEQEAGVRLGRYMEALVQPFSFLGFVASKVVQFE